MRGEKGITLVALVVTIVVLLILAGITITYVLADDGIFGKAQDAARESEVGSIRDYVSNACGAIMFEKYMPSYKKDESGNPTTTKLTPIEVLQNNFPTGYTVAAGTDFPTDTTAGKFAGSATVTKGGDTYTITFDDNGVATVKAGE